jgi:hypothetical protein
MCHAFAIGGGYCLLYNTGLINDIAADPSSPYTYYDMNCLDVVSSASSAQSTAPPAASSGSPSKSASQSASAAVSDPGSNSVSASSPVKGTSAAASQSSTASGSNTCGVAGYDKQSPAAFTSDGTATTLISCSTLCKANSQCKGFAVGGGICLLYASPVGNNVAADSSSPYLFYDSSCSGGSTTLATTTKPTGTPGASSGASSGVVSGVSGAATSAPTGTGSTLCKYKGVETDSANASIVGYKYRPSTGCKAFCAAKSALSYEQYYDYCICFSKSAQSVATSGTSASILFNDMSC